MSKKIENATGLYMEGIRDGHLQKALDKYTGDRYRQHSTGVPDGQAGFFEFFTDFLKRTPKREMTITRAIEDGSYVFLHVLQSLNDGETKWVTMDLFDTDKNDKLIEHWDVIQSYAEKGASGHSMTDGAADVTDLDKTEENKGVVHAFCQDVLIGMNYDNTSKYVAPQYIEHDSASVDGLKALVDFLKGQASNNTPMKYKKIYHLIGQGNFVVIYSLLTYRGDEKACFDIFRLKDGLIVEHWDVKEPIPTPEVAKNSGKF